MAEKKLDLPDPLRPTRRFRAGLWEERSVSSEETDVGRERRDWFSGHGWGTRKGECDLRERIHHGFISVRFESLDLSPPDTIHWSVDSSREGHALSPASSSRSKTYFQTLQRQADRE